MQLHDQTRRTLSLLIFFLLGPLLTFGLLVGIVLRKLPSNARTYERVAGIQTGLFWKIGEIDYRSPNVVCLKNVRIIDDVSAKSVFEAPEIELAYLECENPQNIFPGLETNAADRPHYWRVTVPRSVLKLDHFSTSAASSGFVQASLLKLLSRFPFISESPAWIVFEEVGVYSSYSLKKPGEPWDRIRFLQGNLYRTKEAVRSNWSFQLNEVSEIETQQLSLVRYHRGGFEIRLTTGTRSIPCEFAGLFSPVFQRFGPGSVFSGTIGTEYRGETTEGWTVSLDGVRLGNLDVGHFAPQYTSFAVGGTVRDLRIFKARFGPDQFLAEGALKIVDGSMDRFLFCRLVDTFSLIVRPEGFLDLPLESIPFEESVLYFRLQPDGAVFWPDTNWPDHMFMAAKGDGVRTHPMSVYFPNNTRQTISYHAILSTLAPDKAPVVPLTPGLKKLFSVLPVDGTSVPRRSPRRREALPPEQAVQEMIATTPGHSQLLIQGARQLVSETPPAPAMADPFPITANPVIDEPKDTALPPLPSAVPEVPLPNPARFRQPDLPSTGEPIPTGAKTFGGAGNLRPLPIQ